MDPPVPAFIKNKLAQVTALLVRHEYPSRWPTFFHDLVALLASGGPAAPDVFCRVLDAVDDEIISTGDTLRPHGAAGDPTHAVAPSVRVKDALRATRTRCPSWQNPGAMIGVRIIAGGGGTTVAVAAAATSTRDATWSGWTSRCSPVRVSWRRRWVCWKAATAFGGGAIFNGVDVKGWNTPRR